MLCAAAADAHTMAASYADSSTACAGAQHRHALLPMMRRIEHRGRAWSYTSSLTCSISAAAAAGKRSTGVQPGRCTALRLRTMTLLSLHTARRVRRSTSSGAVQRPRYPGLAASYTSLPQEA